MVIRYYGPLCDNCHRVLPGGSGPNTRATFIRLHLAVGSGEFGLALGDKIPMCTQPWMPGVYNFCTISCLGTYATRQPGVPKVIFGAYEERR